MSIHTFVKLIFKKKDKYLKQFKMQISNYQLMDRIWNL